jgi:hypothetical protein
LRHSSIHQLLHQLPPVSSSICPLRLLLFQHPLTHTARLLLLLLLPLPGKLLLLLALLLALCFLQASEGSCCCTECLGA